MCERALCIEEGWGLGETYLSMLRPAPRARKTNIGSRHGLRRLLHGAGWRGGRRVRSQNHEGSMSAPFMPATMRMASRKPCVSQLIYSDTWGHLRNRSSKFLRRMGYTIPPMPDPQPTIPIAVARRFWNQCPHTDADGPQMTLVAKPKSACARRNW